jgi:hypothetical protein
LTAGNGTKIVIIFKMDDDGSALRVGANYKSLTDLECALNKFQQDNYVQLYKRRFFSAQNVVQYILDGTIQKAQTCVFYHMTYDSIVMT